MTATWNGSTSVFAIRVRDALLEEEHGVVAARADDPRRCTTTDREGDDDLEQDRQREHAGAGPEAARARARASARAPCVPRRFSASSTGIATDQATYEIDAGHEQEHARERRPSDDEQDRDPEHRGAAPQAEAQGGVRDRPRAPCRRRPRAGRPRRLRARRRTSATMRTSNSSSDERAVRAAAVAHLALGDGERAVERRRQRDDDGHDPPERERVAPVDGERRVEDLTDPQRPQDGGGAHSMDSSAGSGRPARGASSRVLGGVHNEEVARERRQRRVRQRPRRARRARP